MKSKKVLFQSLLFLVCASLVLAACAGGPAAAPAVVEGGARQSIGEGEGAVSIIAWAGYIERGETDANYDWVTQFEKDTGCMVSVKVAATSDEMVALMNDGGSTWSPPGDAATA
jgi:putative spermidine/putrescine transport system substrate-binding protein